MYVTAAAARQPYRKREEPVRTSALVKLAVLLFCFQRRSSASCWEDYLGWSAGWWVLVFLLLITLDRWFVLTRLSFYSSVVHGGLIYGGRLIRGVWTLVIDDDRSALLLRGQTANWTVECTPKHSTKGQLVKLSWNTGSSSRSQNSRFTGICKVRLFFSEK